MKNDRRRAWLRGLAIGVAVLAVLAVVYLATPKAEAIVFPGPGVCTYYADAKYKKVVGAKGTGCCGAVIDWGIVTPYKKCEIVYCPDVVCPD